MSLIIFTPNDRFREREFFAWFPIKIKNTIKWLSVVKVCQREVQVIGRYDAFSEEIEWINIMFL